MTTTDPFYGLGKNIVYTVHLHISKIILAWSYNDTHFRCAACVWYETDDGTDKETKFKTSSGLEGTVRDMFITTGTPTAGQWETKKCKDGFAKDDPEIGSKIGIHVCDGHCNVCNLTSNFFGQLCFEN